MLSSASEPASQPASDAVPDQPDDPEIRAERAHLAAARAALQHMYDDVISTETPKSGAEDNDDYVVNLYYRWSRERRAHALIDLPDVPLFFGRLDCEPGTVFDREAGDVVDRIYIGRRHIHEPGGRPLVIDWRAPVSVPFYRATYDDPQRVLLRRRYGFSDSAELTAYEDEPLTEPGSAARASEILAAEIERPRSGPMRDIVATIQPEQDDLVRAPLRTTLCVQGAPGTGKTAVGLHRIAYLLYTERDQLGRDGGVAIVGPNRSFLSYIRHVLPALGEVNVTQTTIDELIGRSSTRADDDPQTARVKGDARMAEVVRRALWLHVGSPAEGVVYTKGASRYRVADYEIREIVAALRGTTRYDPGRKAVAQRIAHAVLVKMERRGESPDDRVQNAVARSKPVKQLLDQVWPRLEPEQVLFRLWSDPDFLTKAAGDDLTPEERTVMLWTKPYRSWRSAKWSPADVALLDELADLVDRPSTLGHLVVDEAQDLSPMQLRALGRRCRTATVLGDLAQATTPWSVTSWTEVADQLGLPDARLTELDRGFRVPAQIIEFAARLLPDIAPDLNVPTGVRDVPDALLLTQVTETDLFDSLVAVCRERLAGEGSVGLIAADTDITAIHRQLAAAGLAPALLGETEEALETARLVCVPAALAKGLEFDAVVVAEPNRIVAGEPRGLHRLYVALTRAVSTLHIVHADPLPDALRDPAIRR